MPGSMPNPGLPHKKWLEDMCVTRRYFVIEGQSGGWMGFELTGPQEWQSFLACSGSML